jgi:hypothetical protein
MHLTMICLSVYKFPSVEVMFQGDTDATNSWLFVRPEYEEPL